MNDSTPSLALPAQKISASQPQMFRRVFLCGHPEEFIEVRRDDEGDIIHHLMTTKAFEDHGRRLGGLPTYRQGRCLNCAKKAKAQDDQNPQTRPKRNLGTYQVVSPSMMLEKVEMSLPLGLNGISRRHDCNDYRGTAVQLHRRVSETEHQAHRLEMQVKAVHCGGKWLAVPARRMRNIPTQTGAANRPAARQQRAAAMNRHEYLSPTETYECTGQSAFEIMESPAEISREPITENNHECFRTATVNTISSSGSKLERERKRLQRKMKSNELCTTANEDDNILMDGTTEAYHPRDAPEIVLPSNTTLMERFDDCYQSPLDSSSDILPTSQKLQHPQPIQSVTSAPESPKKSAMDFIRRRGNLTRTPARASLISKNFRKLGIDVHSATSVKKTDLDSDSPDWACQTSLAIELGRISMESVSKQRRESTRSKHVKRVVQSLNERRKTYSSPSGHGSPASSRISRRSEGAAQASRANAARQPPRFVEMDIVSPKKAPAKHDSGQAPSAVDLNKSLPALPLKMLTMQEKSEKVLFETCMTP